MPCQLLNSDPINYSIIDALPGKPMPSIDGQVARDREMVEEMNIQNSDSQRKNGDQKKCHFIYNNKLKNLLTAFPSQNNVSTY